MTDFLENAAQVLDKCLDLDISQIRQMLTRPPKPDMGDIGFPCFTLAKELKKSPVEIAKEIAGKVEVCTPFSEVRAVGPYCNFVIDGTALASGILEQILQNPQSWGRSKEGEGKTVVLDFSSPNIAKPLGVHHIRSTMIGSALGNLYKAAGWNVVNVNHLGDWGTSFGQLMVSYCKAEAENKDQAVDVDSLLKLYIQFHADAEEDESLADEARDWFRKLEAGDEKAVRMWKVFVEKSLEPLKLLYARLNVSFDYYTGESFFNNKMEYTVKRIEEKGLLKESEGAMVVDLEEYGMPPCLIRKKDGATTYATRDLSAAEYRQSEYGFKKCLYVVANQQELHFRQIYKTLDLMGYDWADGCEHVKFGMLSFGKGVFGEGASTASTRKGNVIFLEDVIDKAVERAGEIIRENARDDEVTANADILAEQVGVGAVVFSEFLQRRMKDVVFTWDKALNLQGDSGPYLQYTHARLSSVKRKYGKELPSKIDFSLLETDFERDVIMKLSEYANVISASVRENEPSFVATYLLELAAVFNRMFTDKERHRIVGENANLSAARVALVEAVRITIENGLALLGLAAPDRM